tara:strand:+ start:681 stop:1892 length:1212 start_codon:yes stop_codon:yes gene_type:complete
MKKTDFMIVGSGLCGLTCALELQRNDKDYILIDGLDRVGGRVGSERKDGFILDLGFQVYNTAYIFGNGVLDIDQLDFCTFKPGAAIYDGSKFNILSDPFKDPGNLLTNIFSNISTFSDKIKVLTLKNHLKNYSLKNDKNEDMSTLKYLRERGFSDNFIDQFFSPFFSGIFLESKLDTSSKFFKYVFSNFNSGSAVIPRMGMQEIPDQIYNKLDRNKVILGNMISSIGDDNIIKSDSGEMFTAGQIVLTGNSHTLKTSRKLKYNSVRCFYFSSTFEPEYSNYIHLFPFDDHINNIAVMSAISHSYTPNFESLFSVSVLATSLENENLIFKLQNKLANIYGGNRLEYKFLKYFDLPSATTQQLPGHFEYPKQDSEAVHYAGDLTTVGSIDGAIESGLKTSKKLLA